MPDHESENPADAPFGKERADLDQSPLARPILFSRPIWRELRTFLAVAKCRSYSQAADLLGSSPPTVSRDVKRLQDQLGVQLVTSTFSGVRLTETGKQIATEIAALDHQLSTIADHSKKGPDLSGRVSISVTSGLAISFVTPSVPDLSGQHPKITLDIREQVSLVDFEKNQSDITISLVPTSRTGVECRKVGILHLVPVASRDYLLRHSELGKAALEGHNFLQCNYYASERST